MAFLSVAALLLVGAPASTQLSRTFQPTEKLTYRVQSQMQVESRGRGLNTWMPEDLTMKYDFTTEVQMMKADGIAQIRYRRPSLTIVEDTGADAGPSRSVEKLNWDLQLTVSPLNKVLEFKDVSPKKTASRRMSTGVGAAQGQMFGSFIGEVYRLALFAGSLDSSLDFSPPLPLREVAVGDTWKATVGFQPQKLKGSEGKTNVQRLDYVYTYAGIVDSNGKKVHRVTGQLELDTDLAEFFHQATESDSEETGLAKFPLKLKTKIDFDLDLKTKRTLAARANSQGGFQIFSTRYPDDAIAEEKLSGGTTLSLVAVGKAK
ncbi:MAG TPA: hypothetical protein VGE01_05100 [Fimbriimonas sp.]